MDFRRSGNQEFRRSGDQEIPISGYQASQDQDVKGSGLGRYSVTTPGLWTVYEDMWIDIVLFSSVRLDVYNPLR